MAIIAGTRQLGDGLYVGGLTPVVGFYDFDTDGSGTGDITLRGRTIPSGAVCVDALIYVDVVPTSGGSATIALKVEGAADINAADAISGAPWSTTGPKRADALTATATPIETTAERSIVATVGTAALTAGQFRVAVWYADLA